LLLHNILRRASQVLNWTLLSSLNSTFQGFGEVSLEGRRSDQTREEQVKLLWSWTSGLFQCSLFLKTRTLVSWLKSTLLLKHKCFDTHIYMKTQCLQTNKMQHYCGKESAWEVGWVWKRVALIKSLIYTRKKRRA